MKAILATPKDGSAGVRDGRGAKQGGCVNPELSDSWLYMPAEHEAPQEHL